MAAEQVPFRQDRIGNVLFEFFTNQGSISVEAWRSTRICKVTVFSSGIRRRIEFRLDDDSWWKLINPVAYSGFWKWAKRYSSGPDPHCMSWRLSILTDGAWFYSSGDGCCPEGLMPMLKGIIDFAEDTQCLPPGPSGRFLARFTDASRSE